MALRCGFLSSSSIKTLNQSKQGVLFREYTNDVRTPLELSINPFYVIRGSEVLT